jgi:WD40 repeat protein
MGQSMIARFPLTLLATIVIAILCNGRIGQTADKPDIFPQIGHSNDVKSVAFSPDGKYTLSGSQDSTLKLWNLASGKEIRTFAGHASEVNGIAFTPDGRFILSGSDDKTLKLWDSLNGKEIRTFTGHSDYVLSVAISPDGKYALSGSRDKTLKLWDIANGEEIRTFTGHSGGVASVAISPDGKYILSGSHDKILKLWELASGKKIRTIITGHTNSIKTVVFSPDGKYALSGGGQTLILWEVSSGKEIRTFSTGLEDGYRSIDGLDGTYFEELNSVAFSRDGKYALAGNYGEALKLWDLASGKDVRTFKGHGGFDAYGALNGTVNSITISPDGKYALSGSSDKTLKLWDLASGKEIRTFAGHSKSVDSVAIVPDGMYVLFGSHNYNKLNIWDITSGKEIRTFTTGGVRSVAISPDGKYALSVGNDNTLKLWHLASGKEIRTFTGHSYVSSVAISPDSKYALSGSYSNTLKLWDLASGKEIRTFTGHSESVYSVAISPDGKYVLSGSSDKTVKLWDIASGEEIRTFTGHSGGVASVAISPDGKYILSGSSDKTIKLWDLASGKEVRTFTGHSENVRSVAISPDGKYALSSGERLKLWDVVSGKEIWTVTGQLRSRQAVMTPNASYILDGFYKREISSGKALAQFISFTDGEWISITPEGFYNASPNGDKHLNVRIGNNVYGIENYREAFFRPDLVKIALSGGSLKGYKNIADIKPPPQVDIVDTPLTVAGDELTIKLKLSDTGGGIGDVRLYLNGSAIMLDNTRSLKVVDKGIPRSYKIRLARGDNIIRAIAFNAENTMQSNPAEQTVTATFTPTSKPTLHALVIGVNEFKNPKLRLQYAVPDAVLFTETLKKGASDLFGKVKVVRLTTPEQTTSDNIASELKKMRSINPDDMFILFVASHGTVDDGEYFLITSNVGSTSTAKLKADALSQERIKELIANIPATKKVIVLDTCNAGQMGEAIQIAMLTRGMSEDTAFKILSRAVGSTILSSATSTQEALEGYQGHGLFTWVLAEGMKGKADKGKTGYIKTTDLVDYVESEVPEIAERHFKRKQYPTTAVSGQGFPIGKTIQ